MALDLLIHYKDPNRSIGYCPFSLQRFARLYWWPIAEKLKLEMLQQIECLVIKEKVEARLLADNIVAFRTYLESANGTEVPLEDREYLLSRIEGVLSTLEQAIAEWDQVKDLSI